MNKFDETRLAVIKTEINLQQSSSNSDIDKSEFVHDILKHLMESYEFDFEGWTDKIEEEIVKESTVTVYKKEEVDTAQNIAEAVGEDRLRNEHL